MTVAGVVASQDRVLRHEATRTELVGRVLDGLAEQNHWLHAMTEIAAADALDRAAERDASGAVGALEGVSIGVKDVIDVAGLETRAGSAARTATLPTRDAEIVSRLRDAGAVVVGKTATTELAAMDPTTTVNPWDRAATPGGSSSGSAAAVGAGLLPLALGTQTAGSLCRPAAYCGIAGWKPTYGLVPTTGMVPLAPTFDTVGFLARTVADLGAVAAVVGPDEAPPPRGRVAVVAATDLPDASPGSLELLSRAAEIAELLIGQDDGGLVELHRTVMAREAYLAHGGLISSGRLGPRIRELLEEGSAVSENAAARARAELSDRAEVFWSGLGDIDAVVTLAVPGPAPRGLGATGPVHYLVPWTTRGGPLVVVPTGERENGLPIAVMVASRPGTDLLALSVAQQLEILWADS